MSISLVPYDDINSMQLALEQDRQIDNVTLTVSKCLVGLAIISIVATAFLPLIITLPVACKTVVALGVAWSYHTYVEHKMNEKRIAIKEAQKAIDKLRKYFDLQVDDKCIHNIDGMCFCDYLLGYTGMGSKPCAGMHCPSKEAKTIAEHRKDYLLTIPTELTGSTTDWETVSARNLKYFDIAVTKKHISETYKYYYSSTHVYELLGEDIQWLDALAYSLYPLKATTLIKRILNTLGYDLESTQAGLRVTYANGAVAYGNYKYVATFMLNRVARKIRDARANRLPPFYYSIRPIPSLVEHYTTDIRQ